VARARNELGTIIRPLAGWFEQHARDLPWRRVDALTGRRDPYTSLVSEVMLQQTQVSRVLEKFGPFLARFPTAATLAGAPESDVLAAWSGLGYYRRARHLHACAREIVARFGGEVPRRVEELRTLPGVGRYTAGSIASIVFGDAAPILDGNVARVLLRVDGKEIAPDSTEGQKHLWARAEALADGAAGAGCVGAFNEGLMELGALVCTPANPGCNKCPLARACVAKRDGLQERIPVPKKRAAKRAGVHSVLVVRRAGGRVLVERRGDDGLWAGLWQAPTLETEGAKAPGAAALGRHFGVAARALTLAEEFEHVLTHRVLTFRVWACSAAPASVAGREWATAKRLTELGMSNPQRALILRHGSARGSARGLGGGRSATLSP
jgi:A/G-specific adenine glycosylase